MRTFSRHAPGGITLLALFLTSVSSTAPVAADVAPGATITAENRDGIRDLVPEVLQPFTIDAFPDLRMEIVPTQDYSPHPAYVEATARHGCQTSLGEDGQLQGYVAGQPFPYSTWAQEATHHACDLDPQDPAFARKLAWNVARRWMAGGVDSPHFGQSLWRAADDNAWRIIQGGYRRTVFSHRADLLPAGGRLVPGTSVAWAEYSETMAPFDMRGNGFLVFRYRDSRRQPDDAWTYLPSLRRVQRISVSQKADSIQGSDFTLEDFFLYSGYFWEPDWRSHGEQTVLAPMDTVRDCYPRNVPGWKPEGFGQPADDAYFHACRFGPHRALPFVDERWEKRRAIVLEEIPTREGHPYSRKLLWYDKESLTPLMGLAFDREGKPLRLQWYIGDWTETSDLEENRGKRVILPVAAAMVNLRDHVSNLMQAFGSTARDLSAEEAKRYYDVTRLRKGH